ncbi:MAG: leucine-rich repeat domain-containing protein [Ruminococcus sp.]|nr:leucine-rich repeat domain-containing protein [Ruminococcus sp.]
MKHHRTYLVKKLFAALCAAVMLCAHGVQTVCAAGDDDTVTVTEQQCDVKPIPDRYNTGASGTLRRVNKTDTVSGLQLKEGGNGSATVLSFYYRNKDVTGTVVIENCDFSGYRFMLCDDDKLDREIKVVFKNCRFGAVTKSNTDSPVFFEFENCTMTRFVGSNARLTRCALGGTIDDAIKPARHVYFDSCYVYDMIHKDDSGSHIDGTQIAGEPGIEVTDLHYDNCRFEMPQIYVGDCETYANACIMLQIEKSNCSDISFTNCTLNGGGDHTIYATQKLNPDGTLYPFDIKDVYFDNIKIGDDYVKSAFYGVVSPDVSLKNLLATDTLYVGSVWHENGHTALSVTNDTHTARRLKVVTDKASYEFTVPALPTRAEITENQISSFYDLPIDIRFTIPEECEYALCLDITSKDDVRQIRFANFSGGGVSIDKSHFGSNAPDSNCVIAQGQLGNNITYALTRDGVLTVSGTGMMTNFHSGNVSPINAISGKIKKIVIEPGVESIGNQAFKFCYGLEEIVLPDGLKRIGSRSLTSCVSLRRIDLPASVDYIAPETAAELPNCEFVTPRCPGDVDGDKDVDIVDVLILRQYLAGWGVKINEANADVNSSRKVDISDVLLIRQSLADWNVELV